MTKLPVHKYPNVKIVITDKLNRLADMPVSSRKHDENMKRIAQIKLPDVSQYPVSVE